MYAVHQRDGRFLTVCQSHLSVAHLCARRLDRLLAQHGTVASQRDGERLTAVKDSQHCARISTTVAAERGAPVVKTDNGGRSTGRQSSGSRLGRRSSLLAEVQG